MVNVVGLGYIGLPTALMLASHGVEVVGTDYDEILIETLKSGKTTFKEEGLKELFNNAVASGIEFSTEYQNADTYIVSVPTPYDKSTKKINPAYVVKAIMDVLTVCSPSSIIVVESTISPGTIDDYVRPLIDEYNVNNDAQVSIVHAPERIIPGNMINELLANNRTIGADRKEIGKKIKDLYASFCQGEIVVTDIRTAEMTKVVENTFRDINIAFANELLKICSSDDLDVYEIIRIANKHPRVNILSPGPGVGGHCISVDPWFLVGDYPNLARLVRDARETNDSMPEYVLKRTSEIMEENNILDPSKVGIYGLTYKEDVDDVRESPTLQMMESMKNHLCAGACKVYDPWVEDDIVPNQVHSLEEFLSGLEMVVVMVGHSQVKNNSDMFGDRIILDTRNLFKANERVYKL